ncbi:TIGR02452 family protein [Nocardia aurantiaca]|uniref:TIGR02452 family protein n=1 Tax=Nocardia aurantiaca TaxID=2675850 RepID=A0A6I3L009_9NOCA|nr:TIGR02452 family protein [Nocardia aurantiaca]MTE15091.1 TIGR02452 family protein [Nocardia aurantiaca]
MNTSPKQIAAENEQIAARGTYRAADGAIIDISAALSAARASTHCFEPEDEVSSKVSGPFTGRLEITAEGSMQAARRLHDDNGKASAVLNFASARNPGGGYLGGARAQEEDLCRSALLYRCLLETPRYYEAHRASDDLRYSHRVIFSREVPVIRDDRGTLTAHPFTTSFLTSPAPNAGALANRSGHPVDVREILTERADRVLAVAAHEGMRELVLGAWGCGVFRNNPNEVAAAFDRALRVRGAAFDRVVFAIWDRSPDSANRAAFEARFGHASS